MIKALYQRVFPVFDSLNEKCYWKENPLIKNDFAKFISGVLIIESKNKRWSINFIHNSVKALNKLKDNTFFRICDFDNVPDEEIDNFLNGFYKPNPMSWEDIIS